VKKSREKSRQKAKETMDQVDKLRKENNNGWCWIFMI
jgi:hypothetical protein